MELKLHHGYPTDDNGNPVILQVQKNEGRGDRRWWALRPSQNFGSGPAVFIGDPLASLGQNAVPHISDLVTHFHDVAYADYAALVACTQVLATRPRLLLWSPGNAAIEQGLWREDELRFMDALNQMTFALGYRARSVLVLPPLPVAEHLREKASERRLLLRRHAKQHHWEVIDAEIISGNPGGGGIRLMVRFLRAIPTVKPKISYDRRSHQIISE